MVDSITNDFNMRECQHVEPVDVRVTALAPNIALMTSEERLDIMGKNKLDHRRCRRKE
jgi:hypothetical protein